MWVLFLLYSWIKKKTKLAASMLAVNCRAYRTQDIINVEAAANKSHARFQIIYVSSSAEPDETRKNVVNPIIDSINLPFWLWGHDVGPDCISSWSDCHNENMSVQYEAISKSGKNDILDVKMWHF